MNEAKPQVSTAGAESTDVNDDSARDVYARIERAFEALRSPVPPVKTHHPTTPPNIPGYEDIEFLARGGQAVVYKARDTRLRRLVALKVIRAEVADEHTIARLRAEAELAAGLDHPHIVPIYQTSEHDGLHYITMAYVDGQSLADRVNRELPQADEAASLIETLASAVEYAHSKGIVHRDLKPANVLLDDRGQPRLADFGLAKLTATDSGLSVSGQIIGTPGFMPPEQARGTRDEVGPAADIYSLGAVLYFLLTGRPPFQSASPVATLEQIIRDEPVAPRRLNPTVPRDLETICLKCLEKAPTHRYTTAAALAEDLQRFRDGKPITARPVSAAQRGWRWCRRNPTVATLASSLVVVTLTAFAVVTWKWQAATASAAEAQRQKHVADENYRKAREIVDRYFTTVSEDVLLNEPGMQPLRRQLLEMALEYYQAFLAERADDPAVQAELAIAYFHVARIIAEIGPRSDAIEPYERAIAIFEQLRERYPDQPERWSDLVRALNNLGLIKKSTGETEKAVDLYQRGITLAEELTAAAPDVGKYHSYLASCFTNLATLEKSANDPNSAKTHFERAIAIREKLLATGQATDRDRAGLALALSNFGNLHATNKDYPSAEEVYRKAIAVRKELSDRNPGVSRYQARVADAQTNLGVIKYRAGDKPAARDLQQEAVDCFKELVSRNPAVAEYRYALGLAYRNLAATTNVLGDPEKAREIFDQAIATLEPLVRENPEVRTYRAMLDKCITRRAALMKNPKHSK